MKKVLLLLVAAFMLLLAIIAMQPKAFKLSRSTVVAALPTAVFPHVNDFRRWDAWSPWAKIDPNCKVEFSGPEVGVGSIFAWSGNNEVGEGRQEIVESVVPERIAIKLTFTKPFEGINDTLFTFTPEGERTRVTWTMSGENNFIGKAISLVIDCEEMLGPQFEQGLAQMKAVVEAGPTTTQPVAP